MANARRSEEIKRLAKQKKDEGNIQGDTVCLGIVFI